MYTDNVSNDITQASLKVEKDIENMKLVLKKINKPK